MLVELSEFKIYIDQLASDLPQNIIRCNISQKAKIPFKVAQFRDVLMWRAYEIALNTHDCYKNGQPLAGHILARSLIETFAKMFYLLGLVERGYNDQLDDLIMKSLFGFKDQAGFEEGVMEKATNILSSLKKYNKKVMPGATALYENLSEYAHPNYTGTSDLYFHWEKICDIASYKPSKYNKFDTKLGHTSKTILTLQSLMQMFIKHYTMITELLPKLIQDCEANLKPISTNDYKNTLLNITIRSSQLSDTLAMVSLSKAKRMLYEKAQPQFWRYAGEEGDKAQGEWFKELLDDTNHVMFTAIRHCERSEAIQEKAGSPQSHSLLRDDDAEVLGFIIGRLMPAPEVYNPGGLTLMIDDFCVKSKNLWQSVGRALIEETKAAAKARGATQIVVVCGAADLPKHKFLKDQNLSIASEWFVGGVA